MKNKKCLKNKPPKDNPINYKKDIHWYENTYDMLGWEWLYDVLRNKLELDRTFSFLSPSANIGKYEKNAYNALIKEGFDPIFYLGDLNGKDLEDKVEEETKLFWISGNGTNASEIKIASTGDGTIPVKVDVILDCKGAIWHCLNDDNEINSIIKLLKNYCNLLKNDNSKLLIDCSIPSFIREIMDPFIKLFYPNRKIRSKKLKMHYFSEFTSFYYLTKYIKKEKELFHPLQLKIKKKNLKDNFDIAYSTKKELVKYVEKIEQISQEVYRRNKEIHEVRKKKMRKLLLCIMFMCLLCFIIVLISLAFTFFK